MKAVCSGEFGTYGPVQSPVARWRWRLRVRQADNGPEQSSLKLARSIIGLEGIVPTDSMAIPRMKIKPHQPPSWRGEGPRALCRNHPEDLLPACGNAIQQKRDGERKTKLVRGLEGPRPSIFDTIFRGEF